MILRLMVLVMLTGVATASPEAPVDSTSTAPMDSLVWISETAAADSLNNYWRNLNTGWYEPLKLEDIDLSPAAYDSLLRAGNTELRLMHAGRPWRFQPLWLAGLGFNRVEGASLGPALRIHRPGAYQPQVNLRADYGFAWKKASYHGDLRWPLKVDAPRDAEGRYLESLWRIWELDAQAGRETKMFGGDSEYGYDLNAVLGGYDPNHYFLNKHARLGLKYRPRRSLTLSAGAGLAQHWPLWMKTDWSLLGRPEDVEQNLPIAGLKRRTLDAGLQWRGLEHEINVSMTWHRVSDTPLQHVLTSGDGSAWYQQFKLSGFVSRRDHWANIWLLSGKYSSVDHSAPLEWKTWLGDIGSLRGYDLLELGGDSGGSVSLDLRGNFEPFKMLHIPLLDRGRIQPILFADFGGTAAKPDSQLPLGTTGWRADVGYGFGKMVGLIPQPLYLRFYAARPVGEGTDDLGWRYLLVFEVR